MSLPNIIQLDGHIQTLYLAVYPDKLLLLDGGCRCDVSLVLSYITNELKRPITDLKMVVVTHMHVDHAGGALSLQQKTGCVIVSSDNNTQWYQGIHGRAMHVIDIGLAYYVARRLGKPLKYLWYPAYLTPDIQVKQGDRLPGFEDWQVMSTPGHTDRDLSLYHPELEVVYTADLIVKLRHKFVAPMPVYWPKRYRQSLEMIKQLRPKQVMMAHGGARYIEPELFDQLIAKAPKQPFTVKRTIKHKLSWWSNKK